MFNEYYYLEKILERNLLLDADRCSRINISIYVDFALPQSLANDFQHCVFFFVWDLAPSAFLVVVLHKSCTPTSHLLENSFSYSTV
jgi:hypothetical protein